MKNLLLIALLFITSHVFAAGSVVSNQSVSNYVDAKIAMLQANVAHYTHVVDIISQSTLTDAELFQTVGANGFSAIESALSAKGFTVKSYYEYGAVNAAAISLWLSENQARETTISDLEFQFDVITNEYEHIIKLSGSNN